MNADWKKFLTQQGASIDQTGQVGFAADHADCAICDLSGLGLIRVEGEDALSFLQGQLTNDLRLITPEHSALASHCSPKGRMLALFRLFRRGDAFHLQLPRELVEAMLKRLGMFKLRAKVTLTDVSDQLVLLGLAGDCAGGLVPGIPAGDANALTIDELTVLSLPGEQPRFQVIAPVAAAQAIWQGALGRATPVNADFWRLLDIRAGLPQVYTATQDAFVPQMANMQLVDGVSFTKGCYTGQEVVARMQYLGSLKRRMYHARFTSDRSPQVGDELFSASSQSGQGAGRIVDVAASPAGGYEALVVSQISSADAGDLQLWDASGPAVPVQQPPYGFPTQ